MKIIYRIETNRLTHSMRFSRGGGAGQKSKTGFYGKTGDIFSITSYKTETMPEE
jgi:hypothetical protein